MAAQAATVARPAAKTAPARRARPQTQPAPRRRTAPARGSRRAATARVERRPARVPMPVRLVPVAVGRTAVAVSGIAESGLVRRLTRGRLWIGLLTTLLVGIVALNVLALSFNATASKSGKQVDALKREISILRAQISKDGASERNIQAEAASLGLIIPEPGAITYLRPKPNDAAEAAKRLASDAVTAGDPSVVTTPLLTPTTTASSAAVATP